MTSLKTISQIFIIFNLSYGALWSSSIPEEMWEGRKSLWLDDLKKFDEDVIMSSARRCARHFPHHPPTQGEFVNLCKLTKKDNSVLKLDSHQSRNSDQRISDFKTYDPATSFTVEVADRELKNMREAIAFADLYKQCKV